MSEQTNARIIPCPDCGKDMSVTAANCFHCGSQTWQNQQKLEAAKRDVSQEKLKCPDCGCEYFGKKAGYRNYVVSCPQCGSVKASDKQALKFIAKQTGKGMAWGCLVCIVVFLGLLGVVVLAVKSIP